MFTIKVKKVRYDRYNITDSFGTHGNVEEKDVKKVIGEIIDETLNCEFMRKASY